MSATNPESPAALIDQVKAGTAARTPLRIVGGDTKAFYGNPTSGEVLSTQGWQGIVSHEPTELVVTVRAGTLLSDLDAVLAEKGQYLPFEAPRFGAVSTIGGVVAAGLAGPGRANVGGVRDYVLGLQFINGKGEWLTFGGQVMKNVAGYDVSRLMAGSLGTLGVITDISLKVLPVAPAEATLVFELGQAEALEQLHRWGGQPLPLNASCWVKDATQPNAPELLFVRLRGAVAAVEAASERLVKEAHGQRMDNAQAGPDWAGCRDQTLPFFQNSSPEACLWRLSLPQTAPVLNVPYAQLIEWQGAQRWLWAPAAAASELRSAARAVNGHATLFRAGAEGAPGVARFDEQGPVIETITQRLRAEFDPAGIFNPGRM
ncbi:glycolate oxidase subunit GlcE [Hydrogenophaga sp. PAMC20947]|nr:glycolate oxidase subunit GlcE [Hydrogenophaga sp. PAMC20947]